MWPEQKMNRQICPLAFRFLKNLPARKELTGDELLVAPAKLHILCLFTICNLMNYAIAERRFSFFLAFFYPITRQNS